MLSKRLLLGSMLCVPSFAALPVITSFTSNTATASIGGTITLNCSVSGATTDIEIDDGSGAFTPTNSSCGGGVSRTPAKTTLYKLVAGNNTGSDGQSWAFKRVFVGTGNLSVNLTNCGTVAQNSSSCIITLSVAGTYANPYEDVVCDVTFTAPSSAQINRTSYWDVQASLWKIRFRPTEAGFYSWSGYCGAAPSGGSSNYTPVSGSFTSTASTAKGFLGLYGSSAPYLLKTLGDGQPFYAIGLQQGWAYHATYGWNAFLPMTHGDAGSDQITFASPDQWLGAYSAAGTTIVRENGENIAGWIPTYCDANGQNSFDTKLDIALGTLINKADAYGVKFMLSPIADASAGFPTRLPNYDFFSNLKTSSCLLKVWFEVFARYADIVDVWELTNESVPNAQYGNTLSSFIRTYDPFKHLQTISNLSASASSDISTEHQYYGDTVDPNAAQTLDLSLAAGFNNIKTVAPNRPIIRGETGDGTGSSGCAPDADPPANERWRDMLWISFFNRAGMIAWNSFHGNGKGCPASITNLFLGITQRAQQLVFSNWIAGFDPLAVPTPVTLGNLGGDSARAYALRGSNVLGAYITHANNHSTNVVGATVTVSVPASGLTATWINPFDGSVLGTSNPGAGSQTLSIPSFSKDIVLKIAGNSPTAVFRDVNGGIQLTSELSTQLSNAGGVFASDPAIAQNERGDTFVVVRDNSDAIWVNFYSLQSKTWNGWQFGGGAVKGTPAAAAQGNRVLFVARDAMNTCWFNFYTLGTGFSTWQNLGGMFTTDPVIALTNYSFPFFMAARDSSDAVWISAGGGGFSGWVPLGAASAGKPSLTVGADGAAYVGIRDAGGEVWIERVASDFSLGGWQPGGGTVATDPQVAAGDNNVYAAALTPSGGVWYNTFVQGTGNNWTGWVNVGGTLSSLAAASAGSQLFLTGQDPMNQLWWYETPGVGWKFVGGAGMAAGPLAAAPR